MASVSTVDSTWWPPKVGDKLRQFDRIERGPIARLCHVVAVFDHDGRSHATIAWYGTHRQRWHYEVIDRIRISYGLIWPDGMKCPNDDLAAQLAQVPSEEGR